jgi:hypothetical protein
VGLIKVERGSLSQRIAGSRNIDSRKEEDQPREEARRATKRLLRPRTVYVLVNALLITINLLTSREYIWFFYTLLGWGIGLLAHGLSVFGLGEFLGSGWEERKIKEIVDKRRGP